MPQPESSSVLFICTANLCRSPMAAALFNRILLKEGQTERWRVESAGTWAQAGQKAPTEVWRTMMTFGLDISAHCSRPVTAVLLETFNLIVVMEANQKEALQVEFPAAAGRIFTLGELAGQDINVADPMGGSLEDFRRTALEIETFLEIGKPYIELLSVSALVNADPLGCKLARPRAAEVG